MGSSQLPPSNSQLPTQPRGGSAPHRTIETRTNVWEWGIGCWVLPILALVATLACGKKGPPLTPIVHVPAEVAGLAVRRLGNEVYVTLTVPAQNIDKSEPASISRVEVFGATTFTPPPRTRFLDIARPVATVPVAPVPEPGAPLPPGPVVGAVQGMSVTVRDVISAEDLSPRELPPLPGRTTPGLTTAAVDRTLRRFYMAIPYDLRGREGPPSAIVELVLTPLPDPPSQVRVAMTASAATVTWEAPGGPVGWLLDNVTLPPERPPLDNLPRPVSAGSPSSAGLPPGPTLYAVYRTRVPDPLALPNPALASWNTPAPTAATPKPISGLTYSEPIELDERRLCYSVRAVRGTVEGPASPPACITPIDVYPPAAPTGLQTLPGEGQITLLWNDNSEADLGGYLVLRREAASDTLLPITPAPIADARFVDPQVTAGVEYVYAVVAVDQRLPLPNMSPQSAEVPGTAQ